MVKFTITDTATDVPEEAKEILVRHQNRKGRRAAALIIFLLVAICLFALAARAQQTATGNSRVEGNVFVRDSTGNQSFVAGAKVKLNGPATLETETNENGIYAFTAVPPGTYTLEAASPGLEARETVRVEAAEVTVPLELRPVAVSTSVVVTAEQAETKNPAPSETISEKTLRDAPNVNERFESSLPLVPGVVRGPAAVLPVPPMSRQLRPDARGQTRLLTRQPKEKQGDDQR